MASTFKPSYGSSVALTTTNLQSLAYSSTFLGAWASGVVDNTSNLSDDEIISVVLKIGTSAPSGTAPRIEIFAYEIMDDTPTYPDTITGSEGTVTLTAMTVKMDGSLKFVTEFYVDATASVVYPVTFRLSEVFADVPKKWGIVIVNITAVALASSGNVVTRTPVQFTVV